MREEAHIVCAVALLLLLVSPAIAQDTDEFVVATAHGIDVLFVPDSEPLLGGDLVGGTLRLESTDGVMITFTLMSMESLHHVGVASILGGAGPTLRVSDHIDPTHALYDSHLLVTPDMIGGSVGQPERETGFDDPSVFDPAGIRDLIPPDSFGNIAHPYRGDIVSGNGGFFLTQEARGLEFDLARLVGPRGSGAHIQFGVLGELFEGKLFQFDLSFGTPIGTPPTVHMDVEEGDYGRLDFTAHASDADGDIAVVQFYDGLSAISECRFTSEPYVCSLSVGDLPREVSVRAADDSGFSAYSESYLSAKPWIRIVAPNSEMERLAEPGKPVRLIAGALAAEVVQFFVDDYPIPGCTLHSRPYECEWTPGYGRSYGIKALATNEHGQADAFEWFQLDGPPLIRITEWSPRLSLTLGDEFSVVAESGAAELVEFFADGELIPGCSFTSGPYECRWTPDVGSGWVTVVATDDLGVTRQEMLPFTVFETAPSRVVGRDLPLDENGNPVLDHVVGENLSALTSLSLETTGAVTLLSIEEVADAADIFSYVGHEPPIAFASTAAMWVGPFLVDALQDGNYSSTYELTFDDGTQLIANIHAVILHTPEPSCSTSMVLAMLCIFWRPISYDRR